VAGIPAPATFTVCELVPGTGMAGASWYGTHPVFGGGGGGTACHVGVLDGSDEIAVLFGAACVMHSADGMAGAAFLGEQGKAILQANDPAWRQLLDGAGLVTADGAALDVPDGSFFTAFAGFSNWMAAAGSVNEAHLLSREIAASLLTGAYAGLEMGETRVLRPANAACYGSHTATTAALVQAAQALVRNDGFTPEGDPNAAAQRCLRDALAGVNTNAAPVLNGHCCDAVYP
jgi:hypothetical protein